MKIIKRISATVVFLFIYTIQALSQACLNDEPLCAACNGVISTDSKAPFNPQRPEMTNHFDWTTSIFKVYHPAGGYWGGDGIPFEITNPYYTNDSYLNHLNYFGFNNFIDRIPANLDFHPENGWELIHRGNGFALDETTPLPTYENRIGPYVILYNKYTGTLRTLAAFNNTGINQVMLTVLGFKAPSTSHVSGLLARYSGIVRPLSEKTAIVKLTQGAPATIGGQFFTADFKVAYDPCICNYNSILYFDFATKNTGQIDLDGRLIGTSVPLDGTGNSPLLNGRDFLTAVHMDGFSVKGGMLTYSNIDKLVQLYHVPELTAFEKQAITDVKSVVKSVSGELDKKLGAVAGGIATELGASGDAGASVLSFVKGLGIIGALSTQLLSAWGIEKKTPNISFIEAEMSLSGTVYYETNTGSGTIELAQPGSKDTEDPTLVPARHYPAYNEALGTFALLSTPRILNYSTGLSNCHLARLSLLARHNYKFDPGSFKYVFNPAAEVNVEKTRIYGALEIEMPWAPLADQTPNLNHLNLIQIDSTRRRRFVTDFYPIESLHRIAPQAFACLGNVNVKLKLQIFYEFLPNRYGKINNSWEVLTYPVEIVATEYPLYSTLPPETISYTGLSISGFPLNLNASKTMNLTGDYTSRLADKTSTLSGGETLNVLANTTIKPGFRLAAGVNRNAFTDPKIPQATPDYVKSFCSATGAYRAKETENTSRIKYTGANIGDDEPDHFFQVYPNPTSTSAAFKFFLKSDSHISISISDLSGKIINTFTKESFYTKGEHTLEYDLSNLAEGFYLVSFESKTSKTVKKLLITR